MIPLLTWLRTLISFFLSLFPHFHNFFTILYYDDGQEEKLYSPSLSTFVSLTTCIISWSKEAKKKLPQYVCVCSPYIYCAACVCAFILLIWLCIFYSLCEYIMLWHTGKRQLIKRELIRTKKILKVEHDNIFGYTVGASNHHHLCLMHTCTIKNRKNKRLSLITFFYYDALRYSIRCSHREKKTKLVIIITIFLFRGPMCAHLYKVWVYIKWTQEEREKSFGRV